MELIKQTPDERDCPLPPIYYVAASQGKNPGLDWHEFANIAEKVGKTYHPAEGLSQAEDVKRFVLCVEIAAKNEFTKAETEKILNPAPTHRVINGAHLFTNYEPPEPPDYFPHDDEPKPAA